MLFTPGGDWGRLVMGIDGILGSVGNDGKGIEARAGFAIGLGTTLFGFRGRSPFTTD